jgi:hypothetical protein
MADRPSPASAAARALALVLLAAIFLRAGLAPVAILDSWSDWKYGQWIWEHRHLPQHEPFSSYSDPGLRVRDGGWLAEVAYYLVLARTGLEGVGLLHGLLETAKAGLFLLAVRRATGSLATAVGATALMEAACWPFFDAIRTQVPAEVCWAGLLLICSGRMPSRAAVVAAPAVVALWANLSPTFGFAFLLLGGLLVGRFFQEVRGRRSLTAAGRDLAVLRLGLMLGLSVAAACCNPYLTDHLRDAFGPAGLAVLDARLWPRLIPVDQWESRVVIASVLVVLAVLRLSPRPFTPAEVLLTATFAGWAWFDKRVAPWWLMLGPWLLAPHLKAIFDVARGAVARGREAEKTSLVASASAPFLVGVAVVLVLLSPAARWAVGRPVPPEVRLGPMVPYHLAAVLTAREPGAPARRVFSEPYWWGDYLLWRLPAGDQVFWYSRPEGFMRPRGEALPGLDPSPAEWRALVERYRFDTLIVRADSWPGLSAYLAERPPGEWVVVEDNTSPDSPSGGPASRGRVIRRADP